jgi:hypothetical protein
MYFYKKNVKYFKWIYIKLSIKTKLEENFILNCEELFIFYVALYFDLKRFELKE